MKKTVWALFGAALCAFGAFAESEARVTSVTAQQRYPWNGLVDITVTFSGASNDAARAVCTFLVTNSATHAALDVSHVTGDNIVFRSGSSWTRRFVWDAAVDVGEVKIEDVALTVEAKPLGGVQLWENGPYWAECNVGATKPEEYGFYFCWGDTAGCKRNADNNGWVSVTDGRSFSFFSDNCPTYGKSTSQLQSAATLIRRVTLRPRTMRRRRALARRGECRRTQNFQN